MRKHILLGVSAVVILATGCASMDDTQRRTATGAGVGALAGAVIGSATGGNAGTGAVLGAGVGALGTYIWSQNMERQKREMEQATRGTGIAVSAHTAHAQQAVAFAEWVADAEAQRGPFAAAGGQPGHAAAWEDEAVNQAAGDFYRATRATLEGAWVRPRHDGYMPFQHAASQRLNTGLLGSEPARDTVRALNALFRESFAA